MKRMTATLASIMLAGGLASFSTARGQEPDKSIDQGLKYLTVALKEEPRIGEYWVGMEVTQPSDDDRKKLEIPADRGILVQQIVPDGPAAKSGLKVGDVLLMAGDKHLKKLSDALEAIRDAKDSDLTFEYLRDGKTDKVTIKPAKRPSGFGFEEALNPPATTAKNAEAQKELARAQQQLQAAMAAQAQGMMGGPPELQKIRAELHEIQVRISAIDQQLAQLEMSRANPNREFLGRQAAALKRAISALMEAGHTEDANRLRAELKELIERLNATGGSGGSGALDSPGPAMPTGTLQPLAQFAQKKPGERPTWQPIEPIKLTYRPTPPTTQAEPSVGELREQVGQLRHELSELRNQAEKAKK